MRLAVYNVENLFDRAKVMNLDDWAKGSETLETFAALNALLGEATYTASIKRKMAALMVQLGLERSDLSKYVILRRNRRKLLKRPRSGGIEIIADGHADWAGSLELRDEPIEEEAMRNTARVMRDVQADILGVVEAEHRPGLAEFNRSILGSTTIGAQPFHHIMLIDGNDERGIDVGLMTRRDYPIREMCSHVDDRDANGSLIFSRDCPEFRVGLPSRAELLVMVNHLKSKGYGTPASSNARRRLQAERIAQIYHDRINAGVTNIAIMGDLNDTPNSESLAPLLGDTDLKDVASHAYFTDGGFPGTYGYCAKDDKIDYILLSPALFDRVTAGGVERRGMWPGVRPRRWEAYEELRKREEAGSDHAALWVEVDV